jgi:hypothetical protein
MEWTTLCLVLIKAHRGQLWKGKHNKKSGEKIEGNNNSGHFLQL